MKAVVKYPKLNPIVFENIANPVDNSLSSTGNHFSAIIPVVASYHNYVNEIMADPIKQIM